MARSLRNNMPKSSTLLISDVNSQVLDRFICETRQPATSTVSDAEMPSVQIAGNVRELAEGSVSSLNFFTRILLCWTAFTNHWAFRLSS
jgi:hypothetical protein